MAEMGGARHLPASLDVLASDVHSRLEFYKNAYTEYFGINNALHCVIEEKARLQLEQNGYSQGRCFDPYVVATHSDGCQGAFGYWVYPLGDGSSDYLQPVWMAVM